MDVERYISTYLGSDVSAAEQFRALTRVIEQLVSYPLRGDVTFVSASTVNVVFERPLKSDQYKVFTSGDASEVFWVTGKTTTGFTLNSTAGSSTATVSWLLF